MQHCLEKSSSEDLDLRAAVNQQLFRVHQQLARRAIRANRTDAEQANALGMSRTASTLAEEMETLFAVAESQERRGDLNAAAKTLRSIIVTHGEREYPASRPLALADGTEVVEASTRRSRSLSGACKQRFWEKSSAAVWRRSIRKACRST